MVRKTVLFSRPTNPCGQTRRFLHLTQNLSRCGSMEDTSLAERTYRHWYVGIFVLHPAWPCMKLHPVGIPLCVLCTDSSFHHLPSRCQTQPLLLIPLDPSLRLSIPPIPLSLAYRLCASQGSRISASHKVCKPTSHPGAFHISQFAV